MKFCIQLALIGLMTSSIVVLNRSSADTISYSGIITNKNKSYVDQARFYLGHCYKWSSSSCHSEQDRFIRQYVNALAGDYKAQKDVIFEFLLPDGDDGPVNTNQVQACAWSQVVSASGSPYITSWDQSAMIADCHGLRPADLAASEARAHAIARIITTEHVKPVAVPQIEYDPARGKNETEDDQ
ncbi:hypothetical protein [Acetobacter sp. DsW_063]|uniref:hypothetical protein n=1 Tax=Acetobacter sp. DsW_063 TaxID=1514894 RepID=UPI000A36AD31|nr:hypothetical protein [Acetobacter sp. DsW_063]OUJ10500.1 hypothetical protein HK28_05230 [Acetobacter sp. DsW_063]